MRVVAPIPARTFRGLPMIDCDRACAVEACRRGGRRRCSSRSVALIALLAFGPRSALGQFLTPLSFDHGWGREVFSFAIAMQNLLWGAAQPFAGGVADRFGPVRVLSAGAILYAARPRLDGLRDLDRGRSTSRPAC